MDEQIEKHLTLLVLQRLPGIAAVGLLKLFDCFGSLNNIITANRSELAAVMSHEALEQFMQFRKQGKKSMPGRRAVQDFKAIEQLNVKLLTIDDENYPNQLKEIHYAPPLLMVRGNPSVLEKSQLAIVGSRKSSPSGLEHAYQFAAEASSCGMTITSGLALGIDGAAHRGALSVDRDLNPLPTVAVVATGLDLQYPQRHQKLADQIAENGAIVSEFPLGTPPRKENFPRRNRIISGLSKGVLVVEAEEKSGSLITARFALEQNREVFAIPGSINSPASKGCHQLIRSGATLVDCMDDIFSELEHPFAQISLEFPVSNTDEDKRIAVANRGAREAASASEKLLLGFMDENPVTIDQLGRRANKTVDQVAAALLSLEIKGWVEASELGFRRLVATE